jgi:AcrR family transcriptional regulator
MSSQKTIRRIPKQARSQQRVHHLLDVAAEVFAEMGYEAATTNAVASRAGVSIGSLYQFFPNKEALVEALVERYSEGLRDIYSTTLNPERVLEMPLPEMLSQFIQALAAFDESHVAFRRFFLSAGLQAAEDLHRETLRHVEELIGRRFPALPAERCHACAVVCVGIVKGLMPLSSPPDLLPPDQLGGEIVAALLAYLRAVLISAGQPLPADLI